MRQLGRIGNTSNIRANNTNKGNKIRSNKVKAKKQINVLIYITA